MKAVFVGGGSFRLLGILRSALAADTTLHGGEVVLADLNVRRAEAVGRMLQRAPEFAGTECSVNWTADLEAALPGAALVGVTLLAGSSLALQQQSRVCREHGFMGSDNVSPSGALLAVRGGPILMTVARAMERHCPEAVLLDFANPVPVLSAMVNNHTEISCLGVCGGYRNHMSDLSRVILGRDEHDPDWDVLAAGINHMSFILEGTYHGRDVFDMLRTTDLDAIGEVELASHWNDGAKANIRHSMRRLVEVWRRLGVLIFSTEGDGMGHLYYDDAVANAGRQTAAEVEARVEQGARSRRENDVAFQELAFGNDDLDAAWWTAAGERQGIYRRADNDIFAELIRAIGGGGAMKVVASRPHGGAITGLKDRHVAEYSMIVDGTTIRPAAQSFTVPDVVHGMVCGLAAHQTLLADAMAAEDPQMLAHALLAYPMKPYTNALRELYRELLLICPEELPEPLRAARNYL